jgi:hypothetical protein
LLSPQEASAVFFNLIGNVQIFKPPQRMLSDNGVKRLIAEGQVMTVTVDESSNADNYDDQYVASTNYASNATENGDDSIGDVDNGGRRLYKRGKANEYMTLILDGLVEVRAGEEGVYNSPMQCDYFIPAYSFYISITLIC